MRKLYSKACNMHEEKVIFHNDDKICSSIQSVIYFCDQRRDKRQALA